MISFKELDAYKDYGRALEIENGTIRAVVTLDVGPRIIYFGFIDGQNIMCDNRELLGGRTDKSYEELFGIGKKWENLGGHRIWAAPEEWPLTYTPDDVPVSYIKTDCGAIFTCNASEKAGFEKKLEIIMSNDCANMQVKMSLKNISDKSRDCSIWALSVSTTGGTLVLPMNTDDTVLLPNRVISVWPYSDIKDYRYELSNKYAVVENTAEERPLKLGFDLKKGISYYFVNGEVFKKQFDTFHDKKSYFDNGCSFETYNCDKFIEIETLGPIETVAPNGEIYHTENWSLYKFDNLDFSSDEAIDKMLESL
ncbi:MAG: hypothetical protein J5659_07330 [Clostridia bacterium]|nr:hypothetical protein [Clostridia bacterium]